MLLNVKNNRLNLFRYMSARLGSVDAICYQITHRATAGQERYNTRWGCEQYYWNDITHPIHLNTGYLKQIIHGLNKQLQAAKAEVVYEKKCKEEFIEKNRFQSTQAQEAIINQKNQEKQYIRTLVEQERELKSQFYNSYRNQQRLKDYANQRVQELQRQLNSIKSKANAPQTSYTSGNSSGPITEAQKKTIQDIVNAVYKSNSSDKTSDIYTKINDKLTGTWCVTTGLTFGEWSCRSTWDKWLILSSNKKSIFVWKQKQTVIPNETNYEYSNSFGDFSEDEKTQAISVVNKYIFSADSSSNIISNIQKEINTNFTGLWGVVTGLENSWCVKAPCEKWLILRSNRKNIFIWKNYKVQNQVKKEEEPENHESLAQFFNFQKNKQKENEQAKENTQQIADQVEQNKNEQISTEFVLVESAGSEGIEEQSYIKVLLNQLVIPNQDPFVRVDWVKQLTEKRTNQSWSTILNVPLDEWAKKQSYKKWYIFQKNGTQVLLWNNVGKEFVSLVQTEDTIKTQFLNQSEIKMESQVQRYLNQIEPTQNFSKKIESAQESADTA